MHDYRYIIHKACAALVVAGILVSAPLSAQEQTTANSDPALTGYPPASDPLAPIEVGSREDVGKESFAKKQGKKVVGGLFKRVLGGSRSSSGKGGPKTRRDPTRKMDYSNLDRGEPGIETGARARWTKDGLLISTRIEESDDKGTFQTLFLEDCQGRRLYPSRLEVYKIWSEHSLTVSWSKTSTVDGRVVSQESGGWSDVWTEDHGSRSEDTDITEQRIPAAWQQVGYDRAQAGVRQVGSYFNVTPEQLEGGESLAFFAHVTRPELDPVMTEPFNWLISAGDDEPSIVLPDSFTSDASGDTTAAWPVWLGRCVQQRADVSDSIVVSTDTPATETGGDDTETVGGAVAVDAADRETRSDWGADSAAKPPCEEAVLRVAEAKDKFMAQLDDPLRLLAAALAAAKRVGEATAALGRANAELASEQAKLDAMEQYLEAWDNWSEGRIEQRARSRERLHGSRQPSWAKGSDERSRKRHQEKSAGLRARVEAQKQNVQNAQQAVNQAQAALAAARGAFQNALAAFANALKNLRGAKDLFTQEVTIFYRCSPCETIASHFASAARLNDLIDKIRGRLEQAHAAAMGQMPQAQQAATAAQQKAQQAKDKLEQLETRRTEIAQEMRDAVDTSDGCLSFEPQEGGSWMNLATMDRVRSTIVPEGAAMGWRSNFKGSDVRVYAKPGCLGAKIRNINWRKINELNRELTDLQAELAEAGEEVIEAQKQADLAQAEVDGLQAEIDAINELFKALLGSGIEQNTEAVLDHLDELSKDCNTRLKKDIEEIRNARQRQREAEARAAAARGARDSLGRRARRAGNNADDIDSTGGTDDDQDELDRLKGKAEDLEERAGAGGQPEDGGGGTSPAPDSLGEADRQRREAEDAADEAEDIADALEDENKGLEEEVDELEDDISELDDRLRAWRRYRQAMARYRDCLKAKQAALEELAEMEDAASSELKELAKMIGDIADSLSGAASDVKDLAAVNKKSKAAVDKANALADALDSLSKAMSILDSVLRRDDLSPSERLKAMSDAFELLRKGLPHIPGVSEMFEFYNEAMNAIAGKLAEIESALSKYYADAVVGGVIDADDAPPGIRAEVKRLVKLRELMRIISRNCGNPPVPPE